MFIKPPWWMLFLLLVSDFALGQCNFAVETAEAKAMLAAKEYDHAAAVLDKLKNCHSLAPLESFEIGWLFGRARHFSEALSAFNSVPNDVPDHASHAYGVALSSFELRNYKGTVEILETLGKNESLSSESANLLGVSYSKLGQYSRAEEVLRAELHSSDDKLPAYLNLVTLYADQDKFAEAAAIASEAARSFPESPEVFIVSGAANTLTGKLEKAHDDFLFAEKLAPQQADPRFFLALTEYKQRQFARAIEGLKQAGESGIVDSDLHYLLAECLLKLDGGDKSAAMTELDKALALNKTSTSARSLRGKLLLDFGHPLEAVDDLELAHRRDPTSRSAAYNLARAYRMLGKNTEARQLFEQLRRNGPDSFDEMSAQRLNQALTRDNQ